jgi:16S rRNA (guanine966-N2)-methyltransferase
LATWLSVTAEPPARQLDGLAFLDLFAGSGAVGLEAASRGADPVSWVEREAGVVALINRNRRDLGVAGSVVKAEVESWLSRPAARTYDLIWLDPPYDLSTDQVNHLLEQLINRGFLAADGLVMVERSARTERPSFGPSFTDQWVRHYGDTIVCFAHRGVPGP